MNYKCIVIGTSAGGMQALKIILSKLPSNLSIPIIIVMHLKAGGDSDIKSCFQKYCKIEIVEAYSNMEIESSKVYFAPSDYHLLVEKNKTLSLSTDDKVNFSRPSIDILFETAADAYGNGLIGIVLTGASNDGSNGLLEIQKKGGVCIVEDPDTAFMNFMPNHALKKIRADYVIPLNEIADLLINYKNLKHKAEEKI